MIKKITLSLLILAFLQNQSFAANEVVNNKGSNID